MSVDMFIVSCILSDVNTLLYRYKSAEYITTLPKKQIFSLVMNK